MLSARALSHVGSGLSGRQEGEEEFDSEDVEIVYSELETIEPEVAQVNVSVEPVLEELHPGERILLKNLGSKVTKDEVNFLRYLYKIPQSVEV